MPSREYVIGKPVGGVNTRTYPTEIAHEEFVMLKNVDPFQSVGAFVTRKGTETWNTTLPVASKPVRGGFRFYYSTGRDLLMVAGTGVYKKSGVAGNFTEIASAGGYPATENRDWSFGSYLNRCYLANGIDSMKRWDPNASSSPYRPAGFPGAIAVGMTPAVGAATGLTGTYYYAVSQTYDSDATHESSGFVSSTSVTVANQKVNLSGIPTGGTARRLYRTEANSPVTGPFYLVATLNASDTTYTDNLADASLGEEMPTDNGVPPAAQFIVFWRGRMVAAKTVAQPQRVFLSAITEAEVSPTGAETVHGAGVEIFPSDHYIDVGDDNSPITGLAVIQDQLIIFKEDQIWNLTGDDAQDLRLWKSLSAVGCIAPKTIVNIRGTVLFVGRNEGAPCVYSYDGSSVDNLSLGIEPTLIENIKDLGNISSQPIQPCATLYRGCYMLAYQKTGLNTWEVAILDTRPPRPRWLFMDKIEASVFIPFYGPGDAGELYYGHASEARVLRFNSTLTDFHATTPTPVEMEIETGWMDLELPYHLKQINWIDIYGREGDEPSGGEREPGDTTIAVERLYDFEFAGTVVDCDDVDVTEATKYMDRQLWKHRIHCEGSEGETSESCFRMKLLITATAPIEIYRIVINFTPSTPEDTVDEN